MIRIVLTETDARRLEQAFLQATDRKIRDRLRVVRMAHRGRSRQDIAADLGVSTRTVQRWLNAYLRGGITALKLGKARGDPPAIPPRFASVIRRWVIEGPAKQGLDRANWTHAELADHLRKPHGVTASRSAMQRSCRRIGIRLYRPCYRLLRGDPEEQAEAKEEFADFRRRAEAGDCAMWDGSTRPTGTGGWCWSSTSPRGIGASRSTRRWRTTRTWSSSGCPATARNSS